MILPDSITEKGILKDQLFDLKGLSAYSSLSVSTLRHHVRDGLPAYSVRGKILVRRSEFDRWLEGFRVSKDHDLNKLADDIMAEIGSTSRRSSKVSSRND